MRDEKSEYVEKRLSERIKEIEKFIAKKDADWRTLDELLKLLDNIHLLLTMGCSEYRSLVASYAKMVVPPRPSMNNPTVGWGIGADGQDKWFDI